MDSSRRPALAGRPRGARRALALVTVLLSGVCAQQAAAQSTPQYVQGSSVVPLSAGDNSADPTAVTCVSGDTCIALGYQGDASNHNVGSVDSITSGIPSAFSPVPSLPADAGGALQEYLGPFYGNNGAISCPTADSCVGVGYYDDPTTTSHGLLTAISNGVPSAGMGISLPSNADVYRESMLFDVSCWSAGSCTAVGYYHGSQYEGLVVPVTGGAPSAGIETQPPVADAAPDGSGGEQLTRIGCWAAGSCVATGYYIDTSGNYQTLLMPITNNVPGTAVKVPLPAGAGASQGSSGDLQSLSCTPTGACVAVGSYADTSGHSHPLVVAINDGVLGTVSAVTLQAGAGTSTDAYLNAVSCSSSGACEAVGSYVDSAGNTQALVVPISAGTPAAGIEVPAPENPPAGTPQNAQLNDVSCVADGTCVAAGGYVNSSGQSQGMTVALNGSTAGAALAAQTPSDAASTPYAFLDVISCAASGACDAVGNYQNLAGNQSSYVVDLQRTLAVATTGLPDATAGSAYQQPLSATGAWGSYNWSVTSGSLPAGLSLDAQTGMISGTPAAAGTSTFTVQATGTGVPAQTATQQLSVTVAKAPATTPPTPSITPSGGSLQVRSDRVRVSLACANAACAGTVTLQANELITLKRGRRRIHRHRTVVIGRAAYSLAAGTNGTVTVKLNGTGRSLLARAKRHHLVVRVVASVSGGTQASHPATIWMKVRKHRRH